MLVFSTRKLKLQSYSTARHYPEVYEYLSSSYKNVHQRKLPAMQYLLKLLIYVYTAQQFTIEPESVVQAERLLAEFECLSPGALAHPWFVNGIASTSLTSEIIVVEGSEGRPSVLIIPASSQFNNSVVQCLASSVSGVVFSRNATLKVGEWYNYL